MDCSEFRKWLDAYLEDTLDEDRRLEFRVHLRECDSCGTWARTMEPSLLFAMAENTPVDLARVEACAAAVTSQIRQQRLSRRLQDRRRPWLAAAAAAVLAVAGTATWQLWPAGEANSPMMSLDAAAGDKEGNAPPTVEVEMPGDDVRVYQFANEGDDTDTAVYFIVNPALEL